MSVTSQVDMVNKQHNKIILYYITYIKKNRLDVFVAPLYQKLIPIKDAHVHDEPYEF